MTESFISPSAIVNDVTMGVGTKIWHHANVYGCKIGDHVTIGTFVEIQKGATIGNNVTVSSHSFICDKVTIEDDVFIGHGVMTINDLNPPSFKRTGTKESWKPTLIKKGAIIGSNVTLFPITIGEGAKIGAGSVVTKDVPDRAVVVGNPAKILRIEDVQ